jgi:hypothetical protein
MSAARIAAPSRPGVVHLGDLGWRYAWEPLRITRFLEATGVMPEGPATVSFAPPRVVVAIAPVDEAAMVRRSRAWLNDAAHVILVRDRAGSVADGDRDLAEVVEADWRDALAVLTVPVDVLDWRSDEDLTAVVERAVDRAGAEVEPPVARGLPDIVEHTPGPRMPVEALPSWLSLERVLATHVVASAHDVTLHASGGPVDLQRSATPVGFGVEHATRAVMPDGRVLVQVPGKGWRIDDAELEVPGHLALGFDGRHPVGWIGHRMSVYWLYRGNGGTGFLSAIDHDFPCGPAKKRYGSNNNPVGVALAPPGDAVAYRFEHDVLVTSAIPIAWREAGRLAVADFPRDRSRAVLFAQTPDRFGFDIEHPLDEDARDEAPALVLGPTDDVRYAVDLSQGVYRITSVEPSEGTAARVGGPDGGFAVFDVEHREVRRATGRLLGGWWRWATVVDGGVYWREDLATGERQRIAPVDCEPQLAVGVPWTRNVVVVLAEGDRRWVALV